MSVHRRMPVIATVERWRQLSGWGDIRVTSQGVADLVWIFFVDARKRKLGEPFSSVNVQLGGCGTALSTHHVRSEEQGNDAYDEFH